jgi:hypothetical protein
LPLLSFGIWDIFLVYPSVLGFAEGFFEINITLQLNNSLPLCVIRTERPVVKSGVREDWDGLSRSPFAVQTPCLSLSLSTVGVRMGFSVSHTLANGRLTGVVLS